LILSVGYISYALDSPQPLILVSIILRGMDELFFPFARMIWVVADHWMIPILFLVAAIVFFCFHRLHLMIMALMAYLFQVGFMSAVPFGEFRVKFYDVGHGLMVWLQTASHTWVYDVPSASVVRKQLILDLHRHMPYLRGGVVISHSDKDHSGGVSYLSDLYPHFMFYGNLSIDHKGNTCLSGRWGDI
jgi:beta-lactamase superfamily II metal-dependent hydrolase